MEDTQKTLQSQTLKKIKSFYECNKQIFDSIKIPTIDFLSQKDTSLMYTKAKLIDM